MSVLALGGTAHPTHPTAPPAGTGRSERGQVSRCSGRRGRRCLPAPAPGAGCVRWSANAPGSSRAQTEPIPSLLPPPYFNPPSQLPPSTSHRTPGMRTQGESFWLGRTNFSTRFSRRRSSPGLAARKALISPPRPAPAASPGAAPQGLLLSAPGGASSRGFPESSAGRDGTGRDGALAAPAPLRGSAA